MARVSKPIKALIEAKGGIQLDIGAGASRQPGYVGMDIQELEGVDIVHDWNKYPWPLPDECVIRALASHVIEHVPPHNFGFINFMNEVWRIMKPEGQFAIVMPYAISPGMYQDPTHCNFCNETTWIYFDPLEDKTKGGLYKIYRPKPWKIVQLFWDTMSNMEVLLEKRKDDRSFYE
jgi:SAM-dependent methyltransferase